MGDDENIDPEQSVEFAYAVAADPRVDKDRFGTSHKEAVACGKTAVAFTLDEVEFAGESFYAGKCH